MGQVKHNTWWQGELQPTIPKNTISGSTIISPMYGRSAARVAMPISGSLTRQCTGMNSGVQGVALYGALFFPKTGRFCCVKWCWLCWFIAVMRRFGDGEIGFGRTPRFILIVGFVLTWCHLPPFFSVSLVLLRVVLVFFLILLGLMKNSERLGFSTFAILGKRDTSLDEFSFEVECWLLLLPEVHLLG